MTRFETLFSIRYAVRVLERHARFWRHVDTFVRLCGLMAGSAAFAALVAQYPGGALGFGIVFAVIQAIEYSVRPAAISAESAAAKKPYATLLARQHAYADADLEAAYQQAVADDDVIVPEFMRALAYNDVTLEKGCDLAYLCDLTPWQRVMATLA